MKLDNQSTRDLRRFVTAVFAAILIALNACQTNQNLQPTTSAGPGVSGFDAADANHDGRMTAEEWSAGDPSRLADFKKRDANHDGVVTKEEAIAYGRKHGIANKIMREADKNDDGFLDRAEVQAYYASREGPPR
jgi:EF hand